MSIELYPATIFYFSLITYICVNFTWYKPSCATQYCMCSWLYFLNIKGDSHCFKS